LERDDDSKKSHPALAPHDGDAHRKRVELRGKIKIKHPPREEDMPRKFAIAALAAALLTASTPLAAEDALKLAIPMRGNWETAAPDLGARAGIFKKHGITFESVYTQGAGETLQVVISGSADIGLGVGTSAVMAAYVKGAPVRVIGSSTTGTNDLYWYVRADSPIKSFKDATENTTIAYSTNGSSSHNFALAILRLHNSKARPTSTGAMPATLTQVMTGQIDIGFAVPPMGFPQLEEGKIRIIGRASEVPGSQDQTVRTTIVHAAKLAKDPEVIARFIRAYAETIDWMYSSDPKVLEIYEDFSKTPPRFTQRTRSEFYFKEMLDPYRISGLDAAMAEAVAGKFLSAPLTKAQLADLFRVPQPGQ
jgi:NitT/TauT family transport system substrate-binding protein